MESRIRGARAPADQPALQPRAAGGQPPLLPHDLVRPVKQAIVARVVALFNDRDRGERPVARRPDGLFGPQAVAWRVHGDVGSMMVGGVAGLLLQMLHPGVLAGVWDHSNFRADMHGRLRRTARFIALTTYGGRMEAEAAIARVRGIHDRVRGVLPDGRPYAASDPALLAWVHVTEATCFLDAWIRYAEPRMTAADQDRYFAEMAQVATALGADPVPRTRSAAQRLMITMRRQLACDARTREVARLVLTQPASGRMAEPVQALAMQAAVDLLPAWARRMHGLHVPLLRRPLIRAGTFGVARTVRWAFEQGPPGAFLRRG
ncbi:oxygenase MpaB family protein [Roseomonas sp. E05]|uniref:oxygenase MpaB family protein n=1 Tax=Roseomonas sp. E05 TaxID=3046310 RepID=UPI0024BAE27C|nr:oxygenase MpaB family protein [Roseomonas sp. E05]MDJ0387376.1 oxygenase MpaB family protein [Roseomonas sp. E05]